MSCAAAGSFGEVHFLCVGTPEGEAGQANLSYVQAAVGALAPHLRSACLIVGKSTVPVGTARQVLHQVRAIAPAGQEVELAWNPEFLREGHAVRDSLTPDRIVLGVTSDCAEARMRQVYVAPLEAGTPLLVTDLETAELVKVAANAFLATKILVHQRHGRDLRGGGRRRDTAGRGARIRPADRPAVPLPRARLRRRLPAQGRPRLPRHRANPGRGLRRQPAEHGGRRQRLPQGPGPHAGARNPGRYARGQARDRARRRVQAQQRRRPGFPEPGYLRPARRRECGRIRARSGRHAQRGEETAGAGVRPDRLGGGRGRRTGPASHRMVRLPGYRPRRAGPGRRAASAHRRAVLPGRGPVERRGLVRARPGPPTGGSGD